MPPICGRQRQAAAGRVHDIDISLLMNNGDTIEDIFQKLSEAIGLLK
jgi:hypothetical protein